MKKRVVSLAITLALTALGLTYAMWMLFPIPAQASDHTVGGACGATIQACITYASPGETVIVPAGTWNESLTLGEPISLTGVSSATAIIQALAGQRVLTVTGAAVDRGVLISGLTFRGGDVSGGNTCYSGDPTNCGGGILLTDDAQPAIRNVIFEDNKAYRGGGLYANVTNGLYLDKAVFRSNSVVLTGGGVDARNIPVTITNSYFQQNSTTHSVGGALRTGADFGVEAAILISNTTFVSNTAQCNGIICEAPAVYLFDQDVRVINSLFRGNSCSASNCDGGGLALLASFNNPTLLMENTDFVSNTAGGRGGGVTLGKLGQIRLVGGRFENNRALSGKGGGFDLNNYLLAGDSEISGTQFISNSAALEGGGLYSVAPMIINGAAFERNSSGTDGGGLLVDFAGTGSSLTNTIFFSNTAQSEGGGAFVSAGNLAVSGGTFSGNSAQADGGGLHACGSITLTNLIVISNTTQENGGGIYVGPKEGVSGCGSGANSALIKDSRFESNLSRASTVFLGEGGGGLYVANSGSSSMLHNTDFINNRAAALGGGVHAFGLLTTHGGLYQGNTAIASSGGGLRAGGDLVVDGTQFLNNAAGFSGGGAQASGPADVRNALFKDNQANIGGGMAVNDVVSLDNVRFISNTAITNTGGGLNSTAALTVTNSLFQGNSSASSGGGLNGFTGQFTLSNTQILSNTALNGGGLYFAFNPIDAVDIVIQGNTASANGGGLVTAGTAAFRGDWRVSDNTAAGDGGGIWANSGLNAQNGFIENNRSTGSGGGYYGKLAILTISGTVFANNQAGGDGGGAYAFDGRAIKDAQFEANSAVGTGGGLFLQRFAHITATQFLGNEAVLGGGLAISRTRSGTLAQSVVNSVFARNSATTHGDGLYYNQPRPINLIHNTFAQATQSTGAAVYALTGTLDITNTIFSNFSTGIENVSGVVTSSFNLFHANGTDVMGAITGSNALQGNPRFVDAASDDFRLAAGSIAIDSGVDAGITTDIVGLSRPRDDGFDRGAYEGRKLLQVYLPVIRRD